MASTARPRHFLSLLRAPQPRWQGLRLAEDGSPLRHLQHGLSPRSKRRTFATSRTCLAGKKSDQATKMPKMNTPAQKSLQVAMAEQKAAKRLPDDIGLLPDTFVMPHGANLPSLFSDPRGRLALERARLWQRGKDTLTNLIMRNFYVGNWRPWVRGGRPSLQRLRIPKIAQRLYEDMYAHFAAGTIEQMAPRLCESIFNSLHGRVASRAPNTALRWTLHRYVGAPAVVSHRFIPAGLAEDKSKMTTLQQAVVRIRSVQSLQRIRRVKGKDGKAYDVIEEGSVGGASGGAAGKEVTEYFVVQRMTRKGEVGDWKVWGTTEETTLAKLRKKKAAAAS
ncbi:hypothetical protein MBLNU459_g3955t1 [Dothideomycetes sp. NU459]